MKIGKMFGVLALALMLFAVGAWAKISVASPSTATCETVYPGSTITRAIHVDADQTGWYTIVATSALTVGPQHTQVYLRAGESKDVIFTIQFPSNVSDQYYTVTWTLYDQNDNYVDDTTECFHVTKYAANAQGANTNFLFGAKEYYQEDGYLVVPLYVTNTGSTDVTVDFVSDFQDVVFTENAVLVRPGRTVEVLAKIPTSDQIPTTITFYAYGNGIRKETQVHFTTNTFSDRLDVQFPTEVTIQKGTTFVPVRITNYGSTTVTVQPKLVDAPFGIASYSDQVTLYPQQTKVVTMIVTARDVLSTGDKVAQLCLLDQAGVRRVCKHIIIHVPAAKASEANVNVVAGQYEVDLQLQNGATSYDVAYVDVQMPKGWTAKIYPSDTLSIKPYQLVDVKVLFKPGPDAEDGVATIYLKSADGTVLAQKTVTLSKNKLTGYAVLGGNTAAWIVVGIVVLALLLALFSKGGKSGDEFDELKAEITKK
ncbi:MAG: hypothetical protein GXN93_00960 [Candidatus Diapherotrites archaeon]|nr:hypothetical protein [Candidatus Diapherotrites archaeon]